MSIGAGLAQARLDAGLTLEQVSAATRVRRTLLEDLERDDYSGCGGDVYARGHIKSYCQAVGVDSAPFLAELDAARAPGLALGPSMTEAFESERRAATENPRRGPNWSAAMAVALAVVVVFGAVSFFSRSSGGSSPAAVPAASTTPAPARTPSATPSPASTRMPSSATSASSAGPTSSPSSSAIAQRPTSGVEVALEVTGKSSWVSASNGKNGTVFYEGILHRGDTRTFTDPQKVRLVLGNAGGVSLIVNGHDLGSPGGSGQVVHVEFGPGDPSGSSG